MWFVGFGALVALLLHHRQPDPADHPAASAALETWRRWQQRKTRSLEQAAYYRVAPRHRLFVGAVYIGLIVVLVLGMDDSHILTSGGTASARSSAPRPGAAPQAVARLQP